MVFAQPQKNKLGCISMHPRFHDIFESTNVLPPRNAPVN